MFVRYLVLAAAVSVAPGAFAQNASLESELADVTHQLADVEAQAARYSGGVIRGLIDARREALLLSQALIENRIHAEAGEATLEVVVPAIQPDAARAAQILGEMAAAQQRVQEAEREAAAAGGLIQALALSRVETERLGLAQLQMGYLQARYGIAFPTMQSHQTASAVPTPPTPVAATPSADDVRSVAWADPRFPAIDYTMAPFELAYRDGHRIAGWWVIEETQAAVDDSPRVIAVNHSLYQPNNFMGQTALVARCNEGETALIFVQDDFLINDYQRNSFEMTVRIDDQPSQQARWSGLTSNKGAGLFGREAEVFIRSIYDAEVLFLRLVERNGQQHDARFNLSGAQDAYEAVAGACGWTTLSLTDDDYRAVQSLLNAGGFDVGTPDGRWGPASQRAMRAYQASVGLATTGAPDRATLERLGVRQ